MSREIIVALKKFKFDFIKSLNPLYAPKNNVLFKNEKLKMKIFTQLKIFTHDKFYGYFWQA